MIERGFFSSVQTVKLVNYIPLKQSDVDPGHCAREDKTTGRSRKDRSRRNVKYGMTNTENVRLYNVCRLWSNKKHFGHASKKNGFSNNLKLRWKPKIAETSQKVDLCHLLVLVAAIFDFRLNHPVYGNDPNLAQNRWCDPIRLKKSGCGRFWLSVMGLKCVSIYNRIWKTVWLTMVKNHKKNTFL